MQFVLPFTKSRPQSGNLPTEANEDEMVETDQGSIIDDDENDSTAPGPEEPREEPNPNHHLEASLQNGNSYLIRR